MRKPKFAILLFILSGLFASTAEAAGPPSEGNGALLYAVGESANVRGSISVYDIAAGHRLIKTIHTVPNVGDVRGVAGNAVTGKLYVAYMEVSGTGMVYCLNIYNDTIVWNRPISPGVDRLAINPDGRLLYVPTWEGGSADYINVLDGDTGEVVRKVYFSNRSHDTLYPLSGPIFQETKATDGSGNYLYLIGPKSYAVSRVGPYSGILGHYAVDSSSNYVVNNVMNLWGMQVANLKTGQIITASLSDHPPGDAGVLHGIGWSPDESDVWESSSWNDPHVYVWGMDNPMAPVLKQTLLLKNGRGSHWLTFDIKGRLIGIGGHLAVPPLPHHRAYGSRTRRFDRVRLGQRHGVGGDRATRNSGCAVLVEPPGVLTCARNPLANRRRPLQGILIRHGGAVL